MIPVFDIETVGYTNPVAVGFCANGDYREFFRLNEEHDVIWDFLCFLRDEWPGIKVYAHNASSFDNKFILNCLVKHGEKVAFEGGLFRLIWKDTDIYFEDSYTVLGRNLRGVCEAFEVEKKLTWRHEETEIVPHKMDDFEKFRMYLRRDCESLSKALERYCELLLDHFGITSSSTISLTAIKAFNKRFYPVKKIIANEEFENFIRQATFGGRNELYRGKGTNVLLYDANWMYTSCYDVPVPVGKMLWTSPNVDKGTIAEAIVKVPKDMFIGPLPYRHNYRLMFPVGEFRGWWDTRELRNATKLGCDVEILRQLECDEAPILEEFGRCISDLGKTANPEMSKIWKLFGLRLSGKFGQHRERLETVHVSEIKDFTGYWPVDDSEVYQERIVEVNGNKSPYIKPAINMRIRSEARIRHLNFLLEAGFDNLYYCDNDSVFTTTSMPTGNNPGELKYLGTAAKWWGVRPKFYGYKDPFGRIRQRTSGFRDHKLTEYEFEELLNGKEISCAYQSTSGWKDILTNGEVGLVDRHRTARSKLDFESRISNGDVTLPIVLSSTVY